MNTEKFGVFQEGELKLPEPGEEFDLGTEGGFEDYIEEIILALKLGVNPALGINLEQQLDPSKILHSQLGEEGSQKLLQLLNSAYDANLVDFNYLYGMQYNSTLVKAQAYNDRFFPELGNIPPSIEEITKEMAARLYVSDHMRQVIDLRNAGPVVPVTPSYSEISVSGNELDYSIEIFNTIGKQGIETMVFVIDDVKFPNIFSTPLNSGVRMPSELIFVKEPPRAPYTTGGMSDTPAEMRNNVFMVKMSELSALDPALAEQWAPDGDLDTFMRSATETDFQNLMSALEANAADTDKAGSGVESSQEESVMDSPMFWPGVGLGLLGLAAWAALSRNRPSGGSRVAPV